MKSNKVNNSKNISSNIYKLAQHINYEQIIITLLVQLLFVGSSMAGERPSNELPMYGGEDKSHIKQNINFSSQVAQLGWEYFYQGDHDTAIKRFNQAWMFDNNNLDSLWGFGLIMAQRSAQEEPIKNIEESIRCLNLAKSLSPKNERLIVDLAYSYTVFGAYLKERNKDTNEAFFKAHNLFMKAKSLQPNFPLIYSNWSVLEFYKGNYEKAQKLLFTAEEYGFRPNPEYVKDLKNKLHSQKEKSSH